MGGVESGLVWELDCSCTELEEISINSQKLFDELKDFFALQVSNGLMREDENKEPFYVWRDDKREQKYFATKWYRCIENGCLYEFEYPDFPAKGFVRKYPDGIYTGTEVVEHGHQSTNNQPALARDNGGRKAR